MAIAPVIQIGLRFIDRDGNDATLTMYADSSLTVDNAFDFALDKINRLSRLSDATIDRIEMTWRWGLVEVGRSGGQRISRNLLLLTQNNDEGIGSIIVPSPKTSIFEQAGPYANIRVDTQNSAVIDFANMLVQRPMKTRDGRDMGQLVTGGLQT